VALFDLTTLSWVTICVAALLVGLSKAGFGAGAGILSVPLMTVVLSPPQMLAVLLPVLICGDVFSLLHYPRTRDGRNLAMLVPGCLAGVGVGMLILDWFMKLPGGELVMRRCIGGICVVFVCVQLYSSFKTKQDGTQGKPYRPRIWHGVGVGTVAGLTSTLAHAGGPLLALFLLPQKLEKRLFVGTSVTYFFIGNAAKLVPYFREGLMTRHSGMMSLLLLPCVVAGTLVGVRLNKRISDRTFTLAIYCLAFAAALYLVVT